MLELCTCIEIDLKNEPLSGCSNLSCKSISCATRIKTQVSAQSYQGRIPSCGVFCGGCPTYVSDANACPGAAGETDKCARCSFHLCCQQKGINHCFECTEFPCSDLTSFSKGWLKFGQNLIDNQHLLQKVGPENFLNHYNSKVVAL